MHKTLKQIRIMKGFTLVELSIVIIIIGFLIAGVAGGQSLIKSASLTTIITEEQSIQTAVRAFIDQYGGLPGDITNATAYFGTTDKNGFTVNNGNGDGLIGSMSLTDAENLAASQELALAGLIPGVYTGQVDPNGTNIHYPGLTPGLNIQASKVGSAGYWLNSDNPWNNYLNGINFSVRTDYVSVVDAYAIDTKVDDGKPFTGRIITFNLSCGNSTSNCSYGNECGSLDKTLPYQLGSGAMCSMRYIIDDDYIPTS
jgi:prepilin-type N-terminal cleavage/methylation domain-containing protein